MSDAAGYLSKAEESLAGADSEFRARRFSNSANRSYYACYQAAITALIVSGAHGAESSDWSHSYVQAAFSAQLILRRKVYSAELRETLSRNMKLRLEADYETLLVSEISAIRAYRRAHTFVEAVRRESERRS